GALTDQFGNPGATFSASYSLDFATVPYPLPLVPIAPLGSLVYDPSASGIIATTSDTDSFTINVNAGQTISVVVTPSASLQPTLTLTAPGGGTTTAPIPAAGKKALLQTVAVGTAAGVYTVTVGSASGTGAYTVQVLLNAALETESNDGA